MAEPVSPSIIEVSDLGAASRELGLEPPPEGTTSIELEILPGVFASITEVEGSGTQFVYMCVADLAAARRHVDATFGTAQQGPDSVDPETLRVRGCVLRIGPVIVDAVHCPRAETQGVPCQEECSPSLSFE